MDLVKSYDRRSKLTEQPYSRRSLHKYLNLTVTLIMLYTICIFSQGLRNCRTLNEVKQLCGSGDN